MPVNSSYRDYCYERLSAILPIRFRNMFGGVGVYTEELFFALIADDKLYFKVDDSNRGDYLARGMAQFMNMPYYAVPADVLEDTGALHGWADKAVRIAASQPKASARKRKEKGATQE